MPTRNCFRRLSTSCKQQYTFNTICSVSESHVAAQSAILSSDAASTKGCKLSSGP